ncbi:hypothetical protein [Corynebacterium sp. 335C]
MIRVSLSSLGNIHAQLSMGYAQTPFNLTPPPLANYSPVPSLQKLATEHSSAMSTASGSAVLVASAIQREMAWAATNLASFINAVESHEGLSSAALATALDGGARALTVAAHQFQARPMFQPGNVLFTPPALTVELSADPEALLQQFQASNDGAVGAAAQYWTGYAASMTDLAATLATLAGRLTSENSGPSVTAAAAMLGNLGARATKVAESSTIISGHLAQMPAIKAMAVNQLSGIIASTSGITKPAAREAVQRAETAAFLTGTYLPQLTTATPAISSLTVPNHGGLPAPAMSGVTTTPPPRIAPDARIAGGSALESATTALTAAPGAADAVPHAASTIAEATPAGMSGPLEAASARQSAAPSTVGGQGGIPSPSGQTAGAGQPSGASAPASSGTSMPSIAGASSDTGTPSTGSGSGSRGGTGALSPAAQPGTTRTPASGTAHTTGTGGHAATARSGVTGIVGRGASTGMGAPVGRTPAAAPRLTGATPLASPMGGPGSGAMSGTSGAGRTGGTSAVVTRGAGGTGPAATAANPTAPGTPSVTGIRRRPARFEQDDNQRRLFGPKPVTVPATIGANVRG